MAIYNKGIYDISDYLQTYQDSNGGGGTDYLNSDIVALFKQQSGQDISQGINAVLAGLNDHDKAANVACLKNRFYYGQTDFRKTPRCSVQGYFLIIFSALIAVTILVKCKSINTMILSFY